MEEIASVYARSLFEVAMEHDKLDVVRDQLGEFADALDQNQEMQVFFFSPYFSTPEKEEGLDKARGQREEMMEQTRRDIEAETRRAIQEIRKEVADLTVLATERVTRKSLNEQDQRRLVEEALSEVDFSALAGSERGG